MYLPHFKYTYTNNQRGNFKDFKVLIDDRWLHHAEVKYRIDVQRGRWYVQMVYVFMNNPLQLLCRRLESYDTKAKAELCAKIFQRGIQRDARGTLKSNPNAFNICPN
ncbi:hypothetical protein [Runella aurantiaca]|uniref:hypothetical protein n=1 Tax=Runella aurantiaca TaxID=2282308 RepID=UPI0011C02182|nr:hypothetical protein [Runella aurantiaca]